MWYGTILLELCTYLRTASAFAEPLIAFISVEALPNVSRLGKRELIAFNRRTFQALCARSPTSLIVTSKSYRPTKTKFLLGDAN